MRTIAVLTVALLVALAGCTEPPASDDRVEPLEPTGAEEPAPPPSENGSAEAPPEASASAPAAPQVVAQGRILVTGPWTLVRSVTVLAAEGVDGFFFPAPPAGTWLTTNTTDRGGLGYDTSLNFHDANRTWLGGCTTEAPDEVCEVPEGAATGEVTGTMGVDLDVVVLALPGRPA